MSADNDRLIAELHRVANEPDPLYEIAQELVIALKSAEAEIERLKARVLQLEGPRAVRQENT